MNVSKWVLGLNLGRPCGLIGVDRRDSTGEGDELLAPPRHRSTRPCSSRQQSHRLTVASETSSEAARSHCHSRPPARRWSHSMRSPAVSHATCSREARWLVSITLTSALSVAFARMTPLTRVSTSCPMRFRSFLVPSALICAIRYTQSPSSSVGTREARCRPSHRVPPGSWRPRPSLEYPR